MTFKKYLRISIIIFSCLGLLLIFLFQKFNYADLFGITEQNTSAYFQFSFNKVVRFLLNDSLTVLIIYGLFFERKYVLFALLVQAFGLFVLLPSYLLINYYFFDETKGWLSYLHRLTLNPVLLMLLIPTFYFQKTYHDSTS